MLARIILHIGQHQDRFTQEQVMANAALREKLRVNLVVSISWV